LICGTAQDERVARIGILRSTDLAILSILGLGFPGLRKRGFGSADARSNASRLVSSAALL
jgi:hypothetical protein